MMILMRYIQNEPLNKIDEGIIVVYNSGGSC